MAEGESGVKGKKVFYTEAAYVLGIVILALGTAFMERADFGLSMVVAPAYLLHRVLVGKFPFFTFGMAEYVFQAVLLAALCVILRRFRKGYLFSFVTAVFYGIVLDVMIAGIALIPGEGIFFRAVLFAAGLLCCCTGVSLVFHTYIPPEVYELFVKEVAAESGAPISRVKTAYDCVSCIAAILMSFAFFGFGRFVGVRAGTVLCAMLNGRIIGRISGWAEERFEFRDALPFRSVFDK